MLTQINLSKEKTVNNENYLDISNFDMENAVLLQKNSYKIYQKFDIVIRETYRAVLKKFIFNLDCKYLSYFESDNSYFVTKKYCLTTAQIDLCMSKIYQLFLPYHPDAHILKDNDNNYYIASRALKNGDASFHEDIFQDKVVGLATIATLSYVFVDNYLEGSVKFQVHRSKSPNTFFVLPFKYDSELSLLTDDDEDDDDEEDECKIGSDLNTLFSDIVNFYKMNCSRKLKLTEDFKDEVMSTLQKLVDLKDDILKILKDNIDSDPLDMVNWIQNIHTGVLKDNPDCTEAKEELDDIMSSYQELCQEPLKKSTGDLISSAFENRISAIEALMNKKLSLKL